LSFGDLAPDSQPLGGEAILPSGSCVTKTSQCSR